MFEIAGNIPPIDIMMSGISGRIHRYVPQKLRAGGLELACPEQRLAQIEGQKERVFQEVGASIRCRSKICPTSVSPENDKKVHAASMQNVGGTWQVCGQNPVLHVGVHGHG